MGLTYEKDTEKEEIIEKKRHHKDDKINEKMEKYYLLLDKKKKAIDKFLKDNYSDFNHSDYTPEVILVSISERKYSQL